MQLGERDTFGLVRVGRVGGEWRHRASGGLHRRAVERDHRRVAHVDEPLDAERLNAKVEQVYPFFWKEGWVIKGDYAPLDAETRAELRRFYRPYNAQLEWMLGEQFGWPEE